MTTDLSIKYQYQIDKKSNWVRRNITEICIIAGGLIGVNIIFFSPAFNSAGEIQPDLAAQLGDFIGGYIGTLFSLVSVVLLYSTLKVQRETTTVEKFETKYFELIKMHRENVSGIGNTDSDGKKMFVFLVREFREILLIVKSITKNMGLNYTSQEHFIISYYCLFFGVGPNSSRILKQALGSFEADFVDKLEISLNDSNLKKRVKTEKRFTYTPFEGHQSRLGHYYRHLYQTICYVDNQQAKIDKYEYVKTIRAQLTTHEQVLLFINSLCPIGESWWSEGLITRYRLVKNIPTKFFDEDQEIDLEALFPKDYFEHQEKLQPKTN